MHPLVFLAGPILVVESLALAVPSLVRWRATWRWPIWSVVFAAVALVSVWVLRLVGYLGGLPEYTSS